MIGAVIKSSAIGWKYFGICPQCRTGKPRKRRRQSTVARQHASAMIPNRNDLAIPHNPERSKNHVESQIQDAFNRQINAELFSSYLYLSMAAYFEAEDLKGMAHWMRIQAGRGERPRHADLRFHQRSQRPGDARPPSRPPRPSGSRRWRPSRTPTSTSRKSPA